MWITLCPSSDSDRENQRFCLGIGAKLERRSLSKLKNKAKIKTTTLPLVLSSQ